MGASLGPWLAALAPSAWGAPDPPDPEAGVAGPGAPAPAPAPPSLPPAPPDPEAGPPGLGSAAGTPGLGPTAAPPVPAPPERRDFALAFAFAWVALGNGPCQDLPGRAGWMAIMLGPGTSPEHGEFLGGDVDGKGNWKTIGLWIRWGGGLRMALADPSQTRDNPFC